MASEYPRSVSVGRGRWWDVGGLGWTGLGHTVGVKVRAGGREPGGAWGGLVLTILRDQVSVANGGHSLD